LLTFIALTWPRLSARTQKAELRQATMKLKEAFAEARRSAMTDGENWSFRFRNKRPEFEISSSRETRFESDAPSSDDSPFRTWNPWAESDHANGPSAQPSHWDQKLFGGVVFRSTLDNAMDASESREIDPLDLAVTSPTITLGASKKIDPAIYLFPSGRATPGQFWLLSSNSRFSIKVVVRGMTGSLSIGPVQSVRVNSNQPISDDVGPPELTHRGRQAKTSTKLAGLN
jgi:hypothetical protein